MRLHWLSSTIGAVGLAMMLLLPAAIPAAAKFPRFDIQVEPAAGAALGRPITVRMTLESGMPPEMDPIEGIVAFRHADDPDAFIELDLVRLSATEYATDVVLPRAGQWVLVPFPHAGEQELPPGYPDPIELVVREPSPLDDAALAWGAAGALLLIVAAGGVLRRRRHAAESL